MGLWIVIAIVLFTLGSIMALKPSGVDQRLDTLRMCARKLGLHPKLVSCPEWIRGHQGEYGRGMIAQYGLVLEGVKLPYVCYKVVAGQWRVEQVNQDGQHHHNKSDTTPVADFRLDKTPLALPEGIEPFVKALTTRANSITIYWHDIEYVRLTSNPNFRQDAIEPDMQHLKGQLETWAAQLSS